MERWEAVVKTRRKHKQHSSVDPMRIDEQIDHLSWALSEALM